jgi:hypothetical protein
MERTDIIPLRQIKAPGVVLSLDETEDYSMLTVVAPRGALSKTLVRECHRIAGDHGACIRFVERA